MNINTIEKQGSPFTGRKVKHDNRDQAFPLEYLETATTTTLEELEETLEKATEKHAMTNGETYKATFKELQKAKKYLLNYELTSNKRISQIDTTFDEFGIYAIAEKLGEGADKRPQYFKIDGTRHNLNAQGISQLDKVIFYETALTSQGEPCLEHETRTPRTWFSSAGTIRLKLQCTQAQAEELNNAFSVLEPDFRTAKEFLNWIEKSGIEKAVIYFGNLANEIKAVTMEEQPKIFTQLIEDTNEGATDINTDTEHISAIAYHLLDDPKDMISAENETWLDRQPSPFKQILNLARNARTLKELGKIGQATYGKNPLWAEVMDKLDIITTCKSKATNTQLNIFWGIYNGTKKRLTPKYSTNCLALAKRIGEKDTDQRKVSAYLHSKKATDTLAPYEIKMLWSCWHTMKKQAVKAEQKKQGDFWQAQETTITDEQIETQRNAEFARLDKIYDKTPLNI